MKVYNENKTMILKEYDLSKGKLVSDTIAHEAVRQIDEQGHYEIVREYENGGKDVVWIVDVEGVLGMNSYIENIQVYIPYTAQEISQNQYKQEEKDLLRWFEDYDKKVSEHMRCQRLNIACHHDIAMLDIQAEQNKMRLNELRELIKCNIN